MASYVAVDKDGSENIFSQNPFRNFERLWDGGYLNNEVPLPKGGIEKLIGRKLTWEDEPVELKEN